MPNMQYWVHISGVQRGPMQIEELIGMGITAETYIWREGLADWVQAREVPELAGFFIVPGAESDAQQVGGDFVVGEQPAAGETSGGASSAGEPAGTGQRPQNNDDWQPSGAGQLHVSEPWQSDAARQPVFHPQPFSSPVPPCPPTNLVWAIIVTILCCQIFGIVAIVYAAQVKSKYDMGQYEKAVKYSESAALWCKLGIAFGLVWLTFYSAIMPFIEIMSL